MSLNYNIDNLISNQIGMKDGASNISDYVTAILSPTSGNTYIGNEEIVELLNKFRVSKTIVGGTPEVNFINGNNSESSSSTPGYAWRINEIIKPTFPVLTANSIVQTGGGTTLHNIYIYAAEPNDDFNFIANNLIGNGNYSLLHNNKATVQGINDDSSYEAYGNVIPYYSSDNSHNYIDIYYNQSSSEDVERIKDWIRQDIYAYNSSEYCFIAEKKKKRSFVFKGAMSLVNVLEYIQDIWITFRYNYNSSTPTDLESYKIKKLLLVEPVYTSSATSTNGW